MLLDWKSIEYIVLGVLCLGIIAALFLQNTKPART